MDESNNFYEEETFGKEGGNFDTPAPATEAVAVKKKKHGLVIALVAAILALAAVGAYLLYPRTSASFPEYTYEASGDTATITGYNGSDTVLTIPSEIDGLTVSSIGKFAFNGRDKITNIIIPDSVTSIGSYAFYNCYRLTSVTIPDSVTSIGEEAFYNCPIEYATMPALAISYIPKDKLKTVVINGGESIGDSAFYYCDSLTSVTIPDSVTSIGDSAFSACSSLKSITIPDSVTSIGERAFSNCASLTSVTIPDSVTSIGDLAFYNCTSLTSVTIPDSVTIIGVQAFYYCDSLTSVTIPDSVTSIGSYAFYNCTSLTSVTIGTGVSQIGDSAFLGCGAIKEVHISDVSSWSKITFEDNYSNPLYYSGVLLGDTSYVAPLGNAYHSSKWSADSDSSTIIDGNYNSFYQYWRPNSSERDETIDNTLQYCGIEFENNQAVQEVVLYIGSIEYHTLFTVKALVDGEWIILGEVYNTDAVVEESLKNSSGDLVGIIKIKLDREVNTDNIRIECTEYGAYAPGATEDEWWMVPLIQEVEIFADTQGMVDTKERNLYVNGEEISGDIILEDGITSLSTHFYGCEKITSIVIPNSVTEIKSLAFSGCDSLTIYCEATEKPSGWGYNWNISSRPVEWDYKG